MNRRTNVLFMPRTWLGRIVVAMAALVLLAVAAVFATLVLVAGMFVATFLTARVLRLIGKAEQKRSSEFLSAEYKVDHDDTTRLNGGGRDRM